MTAPLAASRAGRRALLGAIVAALGGCGFRPVYMRGASGTGAQAQLATIEVPLLPDRSGQLLRQALQERFDRGAAVVKQYTLSVQFGIARNDLAVRQDSTATRMREIATATWTLKGNGPTQPTITTGVARSTDGGNIIDQQYFAADLESESITRQLAQNVADQIALQLASYFALHPPAA